MKSMCVCRKIIELEEELKIVGNNMKSLEIAEQEVRNPLCVPWCKNALYKYSSFPFL